MPENPTTTSAETEYLYARELRTDLLHLLTESGTSPGTTPLGQLADDLVATFQEWREGSVSMDRLMDTFANSEAAAFPLSAWLSHWGLLNESA